ncbi:MAG: glutamyl-tRNA reductase [Kofleriaceae bacterium]
MSELFVVGISWRTAKVAVREKLAFREDEVAETLYALTHELPVMEALLISTCNRVEVYGVASPGSDVAPSVRAWLAQRKRAKLAELDSALYERRGPAAIRHVFAVASSLDSLVVGEAQILGQLKHAYAFAGSAGTSGPVLSRAVERAFGVAKRVRTETTIARGAANVSSVAVELAGRVFGDLAGKSVLVVGAGKMSSLAARHLYTNGAQQIIVTNRSPEKAEALAVEIDGIAQPWADLERLLAAADVVISSTGAREPVLTRAMFKRVAKARKYRPIMIIDIAVPRDAEPQIQDIDGVYLFDIDDLDKVVAANLAERAKAAEHAGRIVEHEAGQFEHWLRTQGVVPTIRALREKFAQIADVEVAKALDQLARKELTRDQQREQLQRVVQLVINKLLHHPTTVLRSSEKEQGELRAGVLAELFALEISDQPAAVPDPDPEVAEVVADKPPEVQA